MARLGKGDIVKIGDVITHGQNNQIFKATYGSTTWYVKKTYTGMPDITRLIYCDVFGYEVPPYQSEVVLNNTTLRATYVSID